MDYVSITLPNSYSNIFFSLTIVVSFIVFSRCHTSKINTLFFSFLILLNFFFFLFHKGANYFTGQGVDHATITLLKFGFRGAGVGDYSRHIALYAGLLILSFIGLILFVFRNPRTKTKSFGKKTFAYTLVLMAFILNPATIDLSNLPTGTFIPSRASSDFSNAEFYKYYTTPKLRTRQQEPKNLVFIYAESLERAFFNEDVFPDLVPRLKELEKSSIAFTNMHMTHGTGGTIWAISASQCGLPLFLPNQTIMTHNQGRFLPLARCLGDELKNEGYHLAYYGGADLRFTGKGSFFKSHGFDEVLGKDELRSGLDDPNYLNFWGLYDDSLFDISYKRFIELSETKEKFGLFLLTIDAHAPGYSSKKCSDIVYQDGKNTHLNAIACTDYQLNEFVTKISESPYADQTLIVINSDHINWKGGLSDDLLAQAREGDKNVFMIIEPGTFHGREVNTRGTAFDIGTTILPFIGYDGEIGLGRDLIHAKEEDIKNINYIQTRLFNWKTEILKLWGQPTIKRSLSIDIKNERVIIDDRNYKIPVVLELGEDLSATLLFNLRKWHLTKYMEKLKPDQKLLMITPCKDIKVSEGKIADKGNPYFSLKDWCFMASTGKQVRTLVKVEESLQYNVSDLEELFK